MSLATKVKTTATIATFCLLAGGAAAEETTMHTQNINPFTWGEQFMNQGRVITGERRVLVTSGQVAWKDDPDAPLLVSEHEPGNFRAQFERALWSLDQVLNEADMSRDDIQHIKFYVTDMEAAMSNLDVMTEYLGDNKPPQSLIGVSALVMPGLMIEIEAIAMK